MRERAPNLRGLSLIAHCDTPRFSLEAVATRRKQRCFEVAVRIKAHAAIRGAADVHHGRLDRRVLDTGDGPRPHR
jgi:hypothetical protein